QADQACGLAREEPFQPEEVVDEVAPQSTRRAVEVGAPEDDRAQRGHHPLGGVPFVPSCRSAGADTGGAPFFSRSAARDWRVDSRTRLKKSRPLPSKKDSQ